MKVYVFTKIKENKNPRGTTTGDIVYIYPIDVPQAKLDINDFLPIVMDLTIPCGENFRQIALQNRKATPCHRCIYNDVDTCDVRKYTQGVWTAGTLKDQPKLKKKRRYSIDRSTFISAESETLVTNDEKTETEKELAFTRAVNNERSPMIIEDKEADVISTETR